MPEALATADAGASDWAVASLFSVFRIALRRCIWLLLRERKGRGRSCGLTPPKGFLGLAAQRFITASLEQRTINGFTLNNP
jgi:hypothetical protein